MSLRLKTALVILVILVTQGALDYANQRFTVLPRFAELEQVEAIKDIKRCEESIWLGIEQVNILVSDWSAWNDTYRFVEEPYADFLSSNLTDAEFIMAPMNMIYICDTNGKVVWGKILDLDLKQKIYFDEIPAKQFPPGHPLLNLPNLDSSVKGIVMAGDKAMMVASQPIITSEEQGPIRGTLIMGRFVDEEMIAAMGEQIKIDLDIFTLDGDSISSDESEIFAQIHSDNPYFLDKSDTATLLGYSTFNDVYGEPTLMIRASIPRNIMFEGYQAIKHSIVSLILVGLISLLTVLVFIDRWLLNRLRQLRGFFLGLGKSHDLSIRTNVGGSDEVGQLAHEVNEMLAKLQFSDSELKVSEERYHNLIRNIDVGMISTRLAENGNVYFGYANPAAHRLFGVAEGELVGRRLMEFFKGAESAGTLEDQLKKRVAGESSNYQTVITTPDGRQRNIEVTASPRIDEHGVYQGSQSIIKDITERKRTEDVLQSIVVGTSGMVGGEFFKSLVEELSKALGVRYVLVGELQRDNPGNVRTLAIWTEQGLVDNIDYSLKGTPCENVVGQELCIYPAGIQDRFPEDILLQQMAVTGYMGTPLFTSRGESMGILAILDDKSEVIKDSLTAKLLTIFGARAASELETFRALRALTASEEKYRLMAENVKDLIWTSDLEGNNTFVSPSILHFDGRTVEEAMEQSIFDRLTPASREIAANRFAAELELETDPTVDQNRSATLVLEHVCSDHTNIWAEVTVTFIRDQAGRATGLLGVTRDVTDRIQAEEQTSKAQERLNLAIEGGELGMWDLNLVDGKMTCNERWAHMVGFTFGEDEPSVELVESKIHPEDRERVMDGFKSHLAGKSPLFEAEHRWLRESGEVEWCLVRAKITKRDQLGTPLRMTGAVVNITDQKQTEDALRNSEERFRTIVTNSTPITFMIDREGTFLLSEGKMLKSLGLLPGEIVGQSVFELYRDVPDVIKGINGALGGEVFEGQVKVGDLIFEVYFSPNLNSQGNVIGVFGMALDITERRQLEEQLRQTQKLEAIGTLAGGIAHDFNNLLFAILGYAELAKDDISPAHPAADHVHEIITAGNRATELVKQILTFARRGEKRTAAINVASIVREVSKLLRSTLPTTIDINLRLSTSNTTIVADPTEIHQVIMNLATNSGYAMMESGGMLEIGLAEVNIDELEIAQFPELEVGPHLVLSVADTGPGIPPEVIENIFEPFFTTKEVGEGTGMGLAVVHGIIKSLCGTIAISSEVGKGTVFKILIPLKGSEPSKVKTQQSEIPGGTESIMVVDDEPAVVRVISETLLTMGYKVESFSDSKTALEAFLDHPEKFDLIITDQTMPSMTGAQLAKRVLENYPGQQIILCTGFSQTTPPEQAEEIGIAAYIKKPVSKKELGRCVRQVLDTDYSMIKVEEH